jgi:hypothetical protein
VVRARPRYQRRPPRKDRDDPGDADAPADGDRAQFLETGGYEHHLRKVRAFYAEQVQLVSAAVQQYFPPGTRITRPAGGFVLWVELPRDTCDAMKLYEAALERKISIAPGPIFSATGRFNHFIRLNCSSPWSSDLDAALRNAWTSVAARGGSILIQHPPDRCHLRLRIQACQIAMHR